MKKMVIENEKMEHTKAERAVLSNVSVIMFSERQCIMCEYSACR